jgi:hypothetical protein
VRTRPAPPPPPPPPAATQPIDIHLNPNLQDDLLGFSGGVLDSVYFGDPIVGSGITLAGVLAMNSTFSSAAGNFASLLPSGPATVSLGTFLTADVASAVYVEDSLVSRFIFGLINATPGDPSPAASSLVSGLVPGSFALVVWTPPGIFPQLEAGDYEATDLLGGAVTAIPEPGSLAAVCAGLALLWRLRRRCTR